MITGKNHIGYQLSATGTIKFKTVNPKLNAETEWEFHEASIDEVDEAAQLSSKAFETYRNYFRDVHDHLINQIEIMNSQREATNEFLNLYMSAMSNKMNEVMKFLTIFASIFIPLTFIAGIYGMNFEIMPELQWRYGYFVICGAMLFLAIILLIYFKRKKWL